MKIDTRKLLFAALALAAAGLLLRGPAPAAAQAAPPAAAGATADDPPARVADLDFLQGSVSFQPAGGGDNDWVAAETNRPLTTGDQLWADTDGLVEMQVGSTTVRMDHNTGISFLNLSDSLIQLQVSAGSVIVRLGELAPNDSFEIDAPNLAFTVLQPGTYQVDVDPDKSVTEVTAVSGEGQVTGGGRSWNITADQQATFTGTDTLDYSLEDADSLPQSSFQQWSAQRDAAAESTPAPQYVSPDMTGSEDLDAYGSWTPEADYGAVWFPTGVAVGWAPYRDGHWVWIAPWGWTWVGGEPWGFAPYHYGRWATFGGRWGWVPGPYVVGVRPVYAPALVGWVGGAPGFSFSVAIGGGGGIAWFPLGPREVFMPTYHVSAGYMTRVNVTNTVVDRTTVLDVYHNNARDVTYANQHVAGGVTVVSHDTFVSGAMVSRNVVNVPESDLASAPVNRAGPAAEPTRASVAGGGRVTTTRPPATVVSRSAVVVHTPAAPASFHGNSAANASRGPVVEERPSGGNAPASAPGGAPGYRPPSQPGGNEAPPPARNSEGPSNGHVDENQTPAPSRTPNVRAAPPVRDPTPQEKQSDTEKEQGWQTKHEEVHQNDHSSGSQTNGGQGSKPSSSKPPHS